MRESLPLTRMSMSVLNQEHPTGRDLRLWLLSAATQHGVTYYRIAGRFTSSGQTWEVSHRYSEFLELRDQLVKFLSLSTDKCPGCHNYLHSIQRFAFPKKHLFASRAPPVVNYRVKALRSFINLLASWAFSKTPKCPTCGGYAFEVVRNFVLEGDDLSADADMNSIRQSMAVEAFAEQNLSSSRGQKPLREKSWMTPNGSMNPDMTQSMYNPHRSVDSPSLDSSLSGVSSFQCRDQQPATDRQLLTLSTSQQSRPTYQQHQGGTEQLRQQQLDPYDAFNDYLPERQSKVRKPSQQNMEQKIQSGKFSSRPLQESIEAKKLRQLREQEADHVFQQKLEMQRSEPLLSAQSTLVESEFSDDTYAFESQPVSKEAQSRKDGNVGSFMEGAELADDGCIATSAASSIYSDEGKLELTGVAMVAPSPASKTGSTDNLWQPWELARVA